MFNANVPLVDPKTGLASRPMWQLLSNLTGGGADTSLAARVTTLESTVASQGTRLTNVEASVSANAAGLVTLSATVTAAIARLADDEIKGLWVRPWP